MVTSRQTLTVSSVGQITIPRSVRKLSFVDCYIATVTEASQETPLWTFDRKLISQCPIAREP